MKIYFFRNINFLAILIGLLLVFSLDGVNSESISLVNETLLNSNLLNNATDISSLINANLSSEATTKVLVNRLVDASSVNRTQEINKEIKFKTPADYFMKPQKDLFIEFKSEEPNKNVDLSSVGSTNLSNISIKQKMNDRANDRFRNVSPTDEIATTENSYRSINTNSSNLAIDLPRDVHHLNARRTLTDNLLSSAQTNESFITKNERTVEGLPTAESARIEETKVLDNRSTNSDEESEFDEFEVETKKEDESSIIANGKSSNKVENGRQLDKDIRKNLKDSENNDSTDHKLISSKDEDHEEELMDHAKGISTNSNNSNSSTHHLTNELEHEEDDEEELEEEIANSSTTGSKTGPSDPNETRKRPSGEKERESLLKLQLFLQNTVEQALKNALPELVKISYGTNLSSSCSNSFLAVTRGLQGTRQWAYKMLDASGKPPSGILDGTLTDFGAFEECLSIDTRLAQPDEINHFTGKYCILDVKPAFDADIPMGSQPPSGIRNDSVIWHPALQLFWSRNSLLSFRYGLCAPSACSDEDLRVLTQYFFEPTGMVADLGFCQLSNEQHADTLQIMIIFALSIILLTVCVGTFVEISLKRLDKQQLLTSSKKSLVDFLICFSIIKNTKRLLNNKNVSHKSQLKHLDGVRFLSTCWIIMGHTYFYTDFVHYHHFRSLAHFKYLDDGFWFMPIANFTLSVETYFFISGMLVVYANWKKLKSTNGKINILEFLVHRVWRLWPPYFVVLACIIILPLFGSGPLWPQAVKNTAGICRKNWWYNVLFINNFQPPDEVCLFHTWFLSANIQFHLVAIPLLYILYRYPKVCFTLCLTSILGCIGWVFHYAQINNLTIPAVIADDVFVDSDQNILTLYILPYYHFGSYLLGMMFGFYLITKKPIIFSTGKLFGLWSISILMFAIVIFLPHESFKGEPTSLLFSSIYLSLHRIVWSLAFGWLVFACATGQGFFINSILSYEFFRPLSSLSYLAYLIHPILMLYHTGMVRERVNLSHYQLLNIFLARVILAFTSAYIIHVIVEVPFSNIERYLFPKANKRRQAIDQAHSAVKEDVEIPSSNINQQQNVNCKTSTTEFPTKNIHQQFNSLHRFANENKVMIPDYYSSSMSRCSYFTSQMDSNFKEKHHLKIDNQRRANRSHADRHQVPSRYSGHRHIADDKQVDSGQIDSRQQLARFNQYPYYMNEQERKYFLYRQKPINQYFYSGSRSSTLANKMRAQENQVTESANLDEVKAARSMDNDAKHTKTSCSNERTCGANNQDSLQACSSSSLQMKRSNDESTRTESTNDTQMTNVSSNNESVCISTDSLMVDSNQQHNNDISTATSSLKSSQTEHF